MSDPLFTCPSECITIVNEGQPNESYIYDQDCLLYCILTTLITKLDTIEATNQAILALLNRAFVAPHASALVSEFMSTEDLDNNGLIYGKDFYITPSTVPPMLKNMNIPKKGISMTWTDYLASVA
jgi:hypothetical protein